MADSRTTSVEKTTVVEPGSPRTVDSKAPYLELRNVHFAFVKGGSGIEVFPVLEDLALSVAKGEFCCVVGPSGCGKSTMLRIIDGLMRPDMGEVRIEGIPVMQPSPNVGMVFQHFHLLPWRTVLGNVEFGLENRGVPKRERRDRAMRWVRAVGLEGFEDYFPAQVSGGMQQRVGLARALAIEPKLLLMDEPFGSVDAQTRMILQGEVLRLWEQEQRTVVFVTHDIEEALFLGDRVVVMGSRPSSVVRSATVPFGRPRLDALRGDASFAKMKEQIWEELKPQVDKT